MSPSDASPSDAPPAATGTDGVPTASGRVDGMKADLLAAPPAATRRLQLRFLRSELGLVFRRRRNLALLGVLAAIPIVIAVAVRLTSGGGDSGGGDGGAIFGSITQNGLFVSFAALVAVLPLFLPMAIAVVAGDSVAGEASLGTLRYLLAVPVDRSRLLLVKFVAGVVWTFGCLAVVGVVGVLAGLILFGGGDVVTLSGTAISFASGVLRLLWAALYLTLAMTAVVAIGLFVSTLTEVPVAAMATTLALTITSQVLDAVPQLQAIHGWLFSHYWLQFGDLLRDPIEWATIGRGSLVALAYIAVFASLAWARFTGRDITS